MSNPRKWSAVAVALQSALAAAITITAISKAAEGVVASTNTLANGEFVVLNVVGMWQLNETVARVKTVSGSGFTLEGIDTTLFDTFISGTAQKITFGTSVTTATEVSPSGGDFPFIPTTTIHASQASQIPGTPSAGVYTFTNIWDITDAGLLAIKAASDAQAKRAVKFTFGVGGPIMCFNGYPAGQILPGGQAQALVTTPTVITLAGTPTYYAS
ncbi:MAG: phage tail tube protein [Candidatus Accumulibacter phosphatis]